MTRLLSREHLNQEEAREAMSVILQGNATSAQIAGFLVALRMKGETADELTGLAQAMRDMGTRITVPQNNQPLLDTCGTGGDGQATLNVSTIAAFVAAGAGVPVAKHGNRSISSHCGSADLLEELGARVDLPPEQILRCIEETGFGFLYAPRFHPAMRHASAARSELKVRTVFNLLGPLTNPAGATAQLVGAPTPEAAELMALALSRLGLRRGYVVYGYDGLDEVSTTGPSHLLGITRGAIDHTIVDPEDFGVRRAALPELRGGDRQANAEIAISVLSGQAGAFRDIVLVNSAVCLMAAAKCTSLQDGMQIARESIDSGAARQRLERFIEFTRDPG